MSTAGSGAARLGRALLHPRAAARAVRTRLRPPAAPAPAPEFFPGSVEYWEQRYARGGHSGVGSYGLPAQFKARFLNEFVRDHAVASVIEFGCGDGNQLSLARYSAYIGLDVAPSAIDLCAQRFRDDPQKSFFLYDAKRFIDRRRLFRAELALSLDVIFHLVEDEVFLTYLDHLFGAAERFVIVYATDSEAPDPAPHVRNRHFTPVIAHRFPHWELTEVRPNPHRAEGGVSDFHVFRRVQSPA